MKKLSIIPMLFACYMGMGQAIDSASIIGKSIRIGNLEVSQNDFPREMNFGEAERACYKLLKGWRLPTREELNILYQNKNKIGGFKNTNYLSSPETTFNRAGAQDFANGYQNDNDKPSTVYTAYIRVIRSF